MPNETAMEDVFGRSLDPYAAAYTTGNGKWYITNAMMAGIKRYLDCGIPPGDFLTAIICNDLKEAVFRADDININNLPAFVLFFYNEAPSNAWGNKEKMEKWMEVQYVRWRKSQEEEKGGKV